MICNMLSPSRIPIRVMLVDDHQMLLSSLKMLLDSIADLTVVGTAATAEQALSVAAETQPDVILLDLKIRGRSALEFLPDLLKAASRSRVLILTGATDDDSRREAIKLGAVGVVMKESAFEVLHKAICKVHEGEIWLDRSVLGSLLMEMSREDGIKDVDKEKAKIESLTKRERDVIQLIGEGLKNKDIAARLFISETTVHHHLTAIFGKLDVPDRVGLIIYAYQHGLAQLPKTQVNQ
jgi:two-component system nitrate/nitrite response regulator NarL